MFFTTSHNAFDGSLIEEQSGPSLHNPWDEELDKYFDGTQVTDMTTGQSRSKDRPKRK